MLHGSERGCEVCGQTCTGKVCSQACRDELAHQEDLADRPDDYHPPGVGNDRDEDVTELTTAELCERYGLPYTEEVD